MTEFHKYDALVKVVSSGDIDSIINRIKKSKGN